MASSGAGHARRVRGRGRCAAVAACVGLVLAVALGVLAGCVPGTVAGSKSGAQSSSADVAPSLQGAGAVGQLDKSGSYYTLEDVVLYLDEYGELPANYLTKREARSLGWTGGSIEQFRKGAAIGGDVFGNRERQLPNPGRAVYRECDIDTDGYHSRGSRRLIYTDDGDGSDGCAPYYYTPDHYETFSEVSVADGKVTVDE